MLRKTYFPAFVILIACLGIACSSDASHYATGYAAPQDLDDASPWARFRGPGGNALAEGAKLPTEWSASENVIWKCDLPGFGTSSAIALGDKLYVTCYSGYGEGGEGGSLSDLMRHVVCVNRESGEIAWQKAIKPVGDDENYGGFMALHGYASNTPVTDGENIYVYFGSSGLYAFTPAGEQLWHASAGDGTDGWGSAASPVIYGDLVIVNAAVESSSLVAFDKSNGEEAWRVDGVRRCWGTPVVYEVDGRHELVLSMQNEIFAVDPATGRSLWDVPGIEDYICSSVVVNDGIIYAIGARRGSALAVRGGEVDGERVVWRKDVGSNVTSPVYYEGNLYWVNDAGIAYCLDAETGEEVYRRRLSNSGRVYASSLAADGKIYVVSRENGTFVLPAGPEFEILATNTLGDNSVFNASPTVIENRLFLRSDEALYCIGDSTAVSVESKPAKKSADAAASVMQSAIEQDAQLSAVRNEATRKQPLHEAIADYVAGLDKLELAAAPQDFRDAVASHRQAWIDIQAYTKDFADLRGEMHDVFEQIRVESNPSREAFVRMEKALFETWGEIEASLTKHGVDVQ